MPVQSTRARPGPSSSPATTPAPAPARAARLLGAVLVSRAAITSTQLDAALEEQARNPSRLGEILIERGWITTRERAEALSCQLALPLAPTPLAVDSRALEVVTMAVARRCGAVPIGVSRRSVRVAMVNPLDLQAAEDIQFRTGRRVDVFVTWDDEAERALADPPDSDLERILGELALEAGAESEDGEALERASRAAPVVQLVDSLLSEATREGASDLHLEPTPGGLTVRIRVDGVLRLLRTLPSPLQPLVVSRLKIMAGMDIAVRRRPQDGGFRLKLAGRRAALRVSTLPAAGGEKTVLRVLRPDDAPGSLAELGMAQGDLRRVRTILAGGQGVFLATGPTGSGKSSTLQAALREVDRTTRNVTTLEDPVEYPIPGATQVQMDPRSGLTFPAALRSILRQDPDVVMVGEVRDAETAEIAMSAAVTGHLVLSSLHTTDAPSALTRLLHMGVPPYLVAAGVAGVVAQRLVRTVCTECQGDPRINCPSCLDGYRGRTGVFQVLVMNDRLRDAVVAGASTPVLRRLARESGMGFLADDARRQVASGVTSPHEVARVVRGDPGAAVPCASCRRDVPPDASGCPWCGHVQRARCRCGSRTEQGWRYCPDCLRPVASGSSLSGSGLNRGV